MKQLLVLLIVFYQKALSPDTGFLPRIFGKSKPTCIYYPTCSEYAKIAIVKYGVFKGVSMGLARIARCNPLHEPSVDLVP
jgi:putative membrane protein insertion efficiency factor